MERKLPTYRIESTPFIVDVEYGLLRHPEQERIGYRFFDDMEDMGAHYRLYIDRETLRPLEPGDREAKAVAVDIPHMVKLDPAGIAEKYPLPETALPDNDRELGNNEELMYRRQIGKPAAVVILGEYFFVDTASGYLIGPASGTEDWLNTKEMASDHFGTCYRCLYDPVSRKEFKPDGSGEIPERIVAIEIPHIRFADSYNVARLDNRLNDPEWFRHHPVRSNMRAKVIPLEKMGYTARQAIKHTERERIPANSKKKGKGIGL